MCAEKGDENYYRCDTDCSDNRRSRRENRLALDDALNDADMSFLDPWSTSEESLLDPSEDVSGGRAPGIGDARYEEASIRITAFVDRWSRGETTPFAQVKQIEKDLRYVGSVIAAEAEERAGDSPQEIDSDWAGRYEQILAEYEEVSAREREFTEEEQAESVELLDAFSDDPAAWDTLYPSSYQHAKDQQIQKYQEVMEMYRRADPDTMERVENLAAAYRTVLEEERPLGGGVDAAGDNEQGYMAIAGQAHNFPSAWINASNNSPYELHIEEPYETGSDLNGQFDNRSMFQEKVEMPGEDGRHYVASVIRLPSNEMGTVVGDRKATHEYMHHLASRYRNRIIEKLEGVHLNERRHVVNGEKEEMQLISRGENAREWGYVDHFADTYMGKVREDHRHFEVMTTGVESLFKGSYYGLVRKDGTVDTDTRDFVLGVMAKI